ncbi:hypothetical protein KAMAJI_00900 [Serratia phage vB_SmaM-Kamaji]|nr:hypothetical protein KAMAJI_00900 [Serratia phage vB_SmaM-Kamaji]
MKVIFIYSNGKTFTANGVAPESLEVSTNEHGDKMVSYSVMDRPMVIPSLLAEAIATSDMIRAARLGKGMSRVSEDTDVITQVTAESLTADESFIINARVTGLEFLVIKASDEDDEAFNSVDAYGIKNFTIVPVLSDFTAPVVVDALRLML